MRIAVIGSGNVADVIADAVAKGAVDLVQIFARNEVEGSKLAQRCGCGFAHKPQELAQADLYLVAVSDKAIAEVSKNLDFGDAVVAHMAGTVDIDALNNKIVNKAVIYPVQTFTKGRSVDITKVPFITETNSEKSERVLGEFISEMSLSATSMTAPQRAYVHLSAVLACNFTNHLYVLAENILQEQSIDFEIIKPLITECARKAMELPSPRLAQSGPASRNDVLTMGRQREMLANDPYLQKLYTNLSQSIWEISKKR